jgi:hypothetical protein
MNRRRLLSILGSLVLFIAAVLIYRIHLHPGSTLVGLGYETTAIAASLALHGTFADPFLTPTGSTAFLAPGYPALIALLLRIFGTGAQGVFALQATVTILIATQLALWPWIARRMQMGYATGFVAATIWLLSDMPRSDVWEAHCVGLIAVVLAGVMYTVAEKSDSLRRILLTGVLWGVALLFSPVALLVLFAWSAALYFAHWLSPRRIVIVVAMAAAMVVPWMARNYVVLHHVVYVRDNLGLELDLANNDCASFSFDVNRYTGCFARTHPNENPEQAALVRNLGEIEYDRRHMVVAKRWIATNPARFLKLSLKRTIAYWIPSAMHYPWESQVQPPRRNWIISLMTILSLPGLFLLWHRSRHAATICLVWLLFFPTVYTFVQYSERFRTPILWATFFPAVFALTEAARWLRTLALGSTSGQRNEIAPGAEPI